MAGEPYSRLLNNEDNNNEDEGDNNLPVLPADSNFSNLSVLPANSTRSGSCSPSFVRVSNFEARSGIGVNAAGAERQLWIIQKDEYCDTPGIPQPELNYLSAPLMCKFFAAFGLIIFISLGWHIGANQRGAVALPGDLSRLDVVLEGCDFVAQFDLPNGGQPYIHYQSWRFMGAVKVATSSAPNSSVRIELRNYKRVPTFRCDAVLHLTPGITKVANEMHISVAGASEVLVATKPQSTYDRLAIGKTVNITMLDAQCHLAGLDVPSASIHIRGGLLELNSPRISNLRVQSKRSPVVVHSSRLSTSLMLSVSSQTSDRARLAAPHVDPVNVNKTDQKTWYLHGEQTVLFQTAAIIDVKNSFLSVDWGQARSKVQEVVLGKEQRKPEFLMHGRRVFKQVQNFIKEADGDPFIVSLRVLGVGLPDGTWQIHSTKAYLALSLEWFVLLSAGMLNPREFGANIPVMGVDPGVDCTTIYELLLDHLHEFPSHHTMVWLPSDGSPLRIYEIQHGHPVNRAVAWSDIGMFIAALLLNLLGGSMMAGYVTFLIFSVVVPYVKQHAWQETLEESTTHRLKYTPSQAMAWHLFCCRVIHPSAGVLLRWSTRDTFSQIQTYQFRCESKSPPHKIAFSVDKQHIDISMENPAQREYVITKDPIRGNNREPYHEPLRNMYFYKFQVVGLGKNHNVIDSSIWSCMIHVRPWITLTDLPFILCRIAFGLKEDHLSSLELFNTKDVAQKDSQAQIMLRAMHLELQPSLLEHCRDEEKAGQELFISVRWEGKEPEFESWDESSSKDHLRIDLDHFHGEHGSIEQWVRNSEPYELSITRFTAADTTLVFCVGPQSGDAIIRTTFRFSELHEQWEKQYDYFEDEEGASDHEPTLRRSGGDSRSLSRHTLSHSPPVCKVKPQFQGNMLTKALGDWRVTFWVAFGDNCPHPKGGFRWMHFPLTPYRKPTATSAGEPLHAKMPWERCAIRGMWPSELILQGTKKTLHWSQDLHIGGQPTDPTQLISLELRPTSQGRSKEDKQKRRRVIVEGVRVDAGQFVWHVPMSDEGSDNLTGRFVVVATHFQPNNLSLSSPVPTPKRATMFFAEEAVAELDYSRPSPEFMVERPLLLSEFEIGYAAFCRSFDLPMEVLTNERLEEFGLRVTELPVGVCSGIRPVLPSERAMEGCHKLRYCKYHGAVVPSMMPIKLDGTAEVFRTSLRMTAVLEGAAWSSTSKRWDFEPLVDYHVDYSWRVTKWISQNIHLPKPWLEKFRMTFQMIQEVAFYFMQITGFIFPPILTFTLVMLQEALHLKFYPAPLLTTSPNFVTDWLSHPSHIGAFFALSIQQQIPLIFSLLYGLIVLVTLAYMNFLRVPFPRFFYVFEGISFWLLGAVSFLTMIYFSVTLMWIMLGALISPSDYGPIAVMVSGLFLVGGSMFRQQFELRENVLDHLDKMMDTIIEAMLDEFLCGRTDKGPSGDCLRVEDITNPGKAAFARALCEVGQEVNEWHPHMKRPTVYEEFTEQTDTSGTLGYFQISQNLRNKLKISFACVLERLPLPQPVEQSLKDSRHLAKLCMNCRTQSLEKLIGDFGKLALQDIVQCNLDTQIHTAMVTVLQPNPESEINVINTEDLSKRAALFLDRQLADQILSWVHCRLDQYRDNFRQQFRDAFVEKPEKEFEEALQYHQDKFEAFVRRRALRLPELIGVDFSGEGLADSKLFPFLQVVGMLPPLDKYVIGLGELEAAKVIQDQVRLLEAFAKKVARGQKVLRYQAVSKLVNSLLDHMQDGRVDHLWWSVFKEICEELYIFRNPERGPDPNDWSYPCTVDDLAAAWMQECSGKILMPVARIEDVVLATLLTKGGNKKIWREAFVLMARYLHVWPEIPVDDAVVEIVTNHANCAVLSHVPVVTLPRRDEYDRERCPLRELDPEVAALRGLKEAAKLGETLVYTDSDLVFEHFGDFSPALGYAMLHFPRSQLLKSPEEEWVVLDWDRDAKIADDGTDTANEPPFPGPLRVYLVFMNLHPHKRHHKARPWIKKEGWHVVQGKRLPHVTDVLARRGSDGLFSAASSASFRTSGFSSASGYHHTNSQDGDLGFGSPSWQRESPSREKEGREHIKLDQQEDKELEPYNEVRMKEFAPSGRFGQDGSMIKLHGFATAEPVLIFFEVQRTAIPDKNSFRDAHRAPFCRSPFFRKLWDYYERLEYERRTALKRATARSSHLPHVQESATGVREYSCGMIDASPDGPDMIRKLLLKEYTLQGATLKEEPLNSGLRVLMAEELRLGETPNQPRLITRTPVWLQVISHDFFAEDTEFRLFECPVPIRSVTFQPTAIRSKAPMSQSLGIQEMAFLNNGCVIWETHGPDDGDHGATQIEKQVDGCPFVVLEVTFTALQEIDQVDFITKGSPDDPTQWIIYGIDDSGNKYQLASRSAADGPYPLRERRFGDNNNNNNNLSSAPESELVSVGKPQSGSIWHSDGEQWVCMRGLWFDAFEELLGALSMKMGTPAAWSLWRHVLSFKYLPVAAQKPAGFITMTDAKAALLDLMTKTPFVSDQTFAQFCQECRFDLDEHFMSRLYNHICNHSPDFLGAHNLVRWEEFARLLKKYVTDSKPYIERRQGRESKRYSVGSLWFEPLYQLIISAMPEIPSREQVRELFEAFSDPRTGLLPMDMVYDVIVKLGRPGVKLAEFSQFIKSLGMQVDDRLLTLTFNLIDINQNDILDELEVQCGMQLLMRRVLPDQVARVAELSTDSIVKQVVASVSVLFVIFLFLLMSFMSLLGGGAGGLQSVIQSVTAGGAALAVQVGKSRALTPEQLNEFVTNHLEKCVGPAARQAAKVQAQGAVMMLAGAKGREGRSGKGEEGADE